MEQKNNIKTIISNVIAALLYVIAVIFLIKAFDLYSQDADLQLLAVIDAYEMPSSESSIIFHLKTLIFVISGFGCAILGRMFQAK